jgi:hypothetical protein
MTPKEKAKWLVLKYLRINNNTKEWFNIHIAKQCALIAVDEIIKQESTYDPFFSDINYWQEVKQEIEKI